MKISDFMVNRESGRLSGGHLYERKLKNCVIAEIPEGEYRTSDEGRCYKHGRDWFENMPDHVLYDKDKNPTNYRVMRGIYYQKRIKSKAENRYLLDLLCMMDFSVDGFVVFKSCTLISKNARQIGCLSDLIESMGLALWSIKYDIDGLEDFVDDIFYFKNQEGETIFADITIFDSNGKGELLREIYYLYEEERRLAAEMREKVKMSANSVKSFLRYQHLYIEGKIIDRKEVSGIHGMGRYLKDRFLVENWRLK